MQTPLGYAITLSVGGCAHSSGTLRSSFLGPMGQCCPWRKVGCGVSVRTVTSNRQPGPSLSMTPPFLGSPEGGLWEPTDWLLGFVCLFFFYLNYSQLWPRLLPDLKR